MTLDSADAAVPGSGAYTGQEWGGGGGGWGGHLGQGEEVGGADEEVAVEGADAQALGAADAHDRLPGRRPRQVVRHVLPQLHLRADSNPFT